MMLLKAFLFILFITKAVVAEEALLTQEQENLSLEQDSDSEKNIILPSTAAPTPAIATTTTEDNDETQSTMEPGGDNNEQQIENVIQEIPTPGDEEEEPTFETCIQDISVPEKKTLAKEEEKLTKEIKSEFHKSLRTFAADIYTQVLSIAPNENIFFSPTSISHALGMIRAGAKGNSSTQIQEALHLNEFSKSYIDDLFNAVMSDKFSSKLKTDIVAKMAARTFLQKSFAVKKDFITRLCIYYMSGIETMNFAESKIATDRINSWVENNTYSLIKDLIPDGAINSLTKLVLINVLYFKAPWLTQFSEIGDRNFRAPSGPVSVPYIQQKAEGRVLENDNNIYLAIPYKDEKTFFFIIMPKREKVMDNVERNIRRFLGNLRGRVLYEWKNKKLLIRMPKFSIEHSLDLKKVLPEMGVQDIFSSEDADLSGISDQFLYVTDFLHKARITVNKDGTEAAAATAVVIGARSLPKIVDIDRPFIFGVLEKDGDILFLGKMIDPSK